MQFTITKSSLLKELLLLQGVVENKTTIPILGQILFTASDSLSISGTDLDVSLTSQCEAEIRTPGAACLPSKKLFDIVRALPEAEIEFALVEDRVTIRCAHSRFKLTSLDKDGFPEIPKYEGEFIHFPSELLRDFISYTSFAITTEASRYTLSGAQMDITKTTARMITTDGHRLSFIEKAGEFGAELSALVPKKALAEVAKLSAETEEAVEVAQENNSLFFRVGKRLFSTRLLTGEFPNYNAIMPKENNNRVILPGHLVAAAVKRVGLLADDRSKAVRFDLSAGKLSIFAQSEVGEAEETMLADYEGPEMSIAFNASYLTEGLSAMNGDSASIELKDAQSQVMLRIAGKDKYDWRYVVMPMRI